ncbi:MAG: hypothetical protein GY811_13155 [Myxococcales bacterium]|nr:hypothetical protein [Myxococcales bacterium]
MLCQYEQTVCDLPRVKQSKLGFFVAFACGLLFALVTTQGTEESAARVLPSAEHAGWGVAKHEQAIEKDTDAFWCSLENAANPPSIPVVVEVSASEGETKNNTEADKGQPGVVPKARRVRRNLVSKRRRRLAAKKRARSGRRTRKVTRGGRLLAKKSTRNCKAKSRRARASKGKHNSRILCL